MYQIIKNYYLVGVYGVMKSKFSHTNFAKIISYAAFTLASRRFANRSASRLLKVRWNYYNNEFFANHWKWRTDPRTTEINKNYYS